MGLCEIQYQVMGLCGVRDNLSPLYPAKRFIVREVYGDR